MSRCKRAPSFSDMVKHLPTYSESMDGKHRSRYLDPELWDEAGLFWAPVRGPAAQEVDPPLQAGCPLVAAHPGDPVLCFVPQDQVMSAWRDLRGEEASESNRGWTPMLYRHGDRQLVLLHGYC